MKKILAAFLTLLTLFGTMAAAVSAGDLSLYQDFIYDDTFKLGDINGDGSVNSIDSLLLRTVVAGVADGEIVEEAGDFDGNGSCNAPDSYNLKVCLAGLRSISSFENGRQVYKMTIGGIDISDMSIVLPSGTTSNDNVYLAYLNFMKYTREVTGVEMPLTYGSARTENAVYFHDVELDSELGQILGVEGYRYDVTDGDLNIYGTYRGNMYAVYDILEIYLGIRFFSSSETFVYKQRSVDIPEGVSVEKIPEITFRYARHTFGRNAQYHFFPNKLNGSQLSGHDEAFWGTKIGPLYSNAHSFVEYWQMGTGSWAEGSGRPEGMSEYIYNADEYQYKYDSGTPYGEHKGKDVYSWQPCATSESDFDVLFEGMIDCNRMVMSWGRPTFIEEGQTLFSFSISDNQCYCDCRNCVKISRNEGYSGLYLQMYNKATERAQEYYPGVRLYGIVYAKDFPKTIKPHKNFVILYCGTGCNNHILGKEDCYSKGGQLTDVSTNKGMSNALDEEALVFWGSLCKETGAELWFWIYPVTYHYYLSSCPNVLNFYWDMKWLHEEANVTGFFYEGGGTTYNFETLKEYASVKYMWDMDMTYDEWLGIVKEYLYINYGDGYEELFTYIEMQTEAGDQCGTCFINNFDRPGDMYSYEYLAEHYDEMRGLLETAYAKAGTSAQRKRIETLLVCCDFMGLSSVHTDWFTEGNNVELYKERYDWMYNYIKNNNMRIFSSSVYVLPDSIDYTVNPMIQIYEDGSRRIGIYP